MNQYLRLDLARNASSHVRSPWTLSVRESRTLSIPFRAGGPGEQRTYPKCYEVVTRPTALICKLEEPPSLGRDRDTALL